MQTQFLHFGARYLTKKNKIDMYLAKMLDFSCEVYCVAAFGVVFHLYIETFRKRWCVVVEGWCVGCNPPFVDCGIRLIGLPAPFR
jgi:hypothetical protein